MRNIDVGNPVGIEIKKVLIENGIDLKSKIGEDDLMMLKDHLVEKHKEEEQVEQQYADRDRMNDPQI